MVVPTDLDSAASVSRCTSSYPCFNALGYGFETVIPLVSGEQVEAWRIDASASGSRALQVYLAVAAFLGLLLSSTAVGALVGILRRE